MRTMFLAKDDGRLIGLEASLAGAFLTAAVVLRQLGWMSLGFAIILGTLSLVVLVVLAWTRFNDGLHPCFLFLGMLLLFQGGRLIGFCFGIIDSPFDIVVQTPYPLTVSSETAERTLFVIVSSGLLIYLTCRWPATSLPGPSTSSLQEWLPAAYMLSAIVFPVLVYKNIVYLNYVRTHGGYLAVYTDSQAILDAAGPLVRAISLLASTLFILLWVVEKRTKMLFVIAVAYLGCSALDLMIGFRGKVFLLIVTMWYISNLKKARGFRLSSLALIIGCTSVLAAVTAGFRENKEIASLSPLGFISAQGVSIGVTEAAIEYYDIFHRNALRYVINGLATAYRPSASFEQGELFDNDLSIFLNQEAFELGFGTGSSYLAEAWLFGGIVGTIVASLCIGLILRGMHAAGQWTLGIILQGLFLPAMIYLPRTGLLEPVAAGLKNTVALCIIVLLLIGIRKMMAGAVAPLQFTPKRAGDSPAAAKVRPLT